MSSKYFLPGVTAVTACIRRHHVLLKEAVTECKFGKVVDIYRSQFRCSASSLKVSSLKASLNMLSMFLAFWVHYPLACS